MDGDNCLDASVWVELFGKFVCFSARLTSVTDLGGRGDYFTARSNLET